MLTALLLASTALADPVTYEDVDLKELMLRSQLVVVARMASPAWATTDVPVNAAKPQCGTYPMAQYNFVVVEVLKGRSATQPTGNVSAIGAAAGAMMEGARHYCDTGKQVAKTTLRYSYGVTAPRQGDEVLVFLNKHPEWGYELAGQNGFEPATPGSINRTRKWALKGY